MSPIKIFLSYAHEDEEQLNKLRNHLADLRRRKVIDDWHDRQIRAGEDWKGKIDERLRAADLIIFLVSDDFMGSEYANDIEVKLAVERHQAGEAKVIPVILSPVLWEESVFGGMQALPKDGKPVSIWPNEDEAFVDIARGIQQAAQGDSDEDPDQVPSLPLPRRRKKRYVTQTLLVAAVCLSALGMIFLRSEDPAIPPDPPPPSPRPGLAVLPLRNLSSDEGFVENLTETLISCIASELEDEVRVTSRQSVLRYKDSDTPLPEIADDLKVQMIIQGSVTSSPGNRARVASQLSRTTLDDGEELFWSYAQNVDLRDALRAQCEVAEAMSKGIKAKLGIKRNGDGLDRRCEPCQASANPDAYTAYVLGRSALNRRSSSGSLASAIVYLQKALEHDPDYAPAHASLANAYSLSGYYGLLGDGQTSPREYLEKARTHAQKALEIDPKLADAHTALGIVQLFSDHDWSKAEESFGQAIALNQNYADAYYFYWFALFSRGERQQAAEKIGQAYKQDPLSPGINMNLGLHAILDGKYEDAMRLIQEAKRLEPAYPGPELYMSILYRRQGNGDLDFEHFWRFLNLRYPDIIPGIRLSGEPGGRQAALETAARELESLWQRRIIPPEDVARVYLRLGNNSKALEWLELSWERGFPAVLLFGVSGEWDALSSETRFMDLLKKIRGNQGNDEPESGVRSK